MKNGKCSSEVASHFSLVLCACVIMGKWGTMWIEVDKRKYTKSVQAFDKNVKVCFVYNVYFDIYSSGQIQFPVFYWLLDMIIERDRDHRRVIERKTASWAEVGCSDRGYGRIAWMWHPGHTRACHVPLSALLWSQSFDWWPQPQSHIGKWWLQWLSWSWCYKLWWIIASLYSIW